MNYQEKIIEWVQIYLDHIREISLERHVSDEEGYKFASVDNFQKQFNLNDPDLAGNLERAILNNNLVVGNQHFPRQMLILYAQYFPEATRSILQNLFESSKDIVSRLNSAKDAFDSLNERLQRESSKPYKHSYIGLRFLSLLLSYRFPNQYNPLKPAEWKVFSRFLNPEFGIPYRTPIGEQYRKYEEYIQPLLEYIKKREDISAIKERLVENLTFQDDEFRWMAQDIIYVTARVYANMRSNEVAVSEVTPPEKDKVVLAQDDLIIDEESTGLMPREEHLEDYMVKNWRSIPFGEKLELYKDEDGNIGQQYTTDVGIIDLLATDEHGDYVVIELKRAEYNYKVVGQLLNYMTWVQENIAKGHKVRGLIIVGKADNTLKHALRQISDKVALKEYKMEMKLNNTN